MLFIGFFIPLSRKTKKSDHLSRKIALIAATVQGSGFKVQTLLKMFVQRFILSQV
jgi:hypothetical protein